MSFRKIQTQSYGRTVTLEQVEHHNYRGTVYVLSWGKNRLNAWGYGRGHTEAIESFINVARFQRMADDYIETLARTHPDIIKIEKGQPLATSVKCGCEYGATRTDDIFIQKVRTGLIKGCSECQQPFQLQGGE